MSDTTIHGTCYCHPAGMYDGQQCTCRFHHSVADDRQTVSPRLASFLVSAAQSLDVIALETAAHGLDDQAKKLCNIARILRERRTS